MRPTYEYVMKGHLHSALSYYYYYYYIVVFVVVENIDASALQCLKI